MKTLIARMNELGVPLPMVRDPATGKGSVSVTLVVISGGYVMLALLNSAAQLIKGVDVVNALYWFGMCYSGYLGRTIIKKATATK